MFQWYLFVLVFAVGAISYFGGLTYKVCPYGQIETRYRWIAAAIILVPMVYLAATRTSGFGDTSAYISMFQEAPSSISELPSYLSSYTKDQGFAVFMVLIKSLIGSSERLFLGIVAGICLLFVFFVYRRYSCNFIITIFLFLASADYVQWTYNGIRQFIAVTMVFACSGLILKKKYVPVILVILAASCIHQSALLMIPVIFIVQGKPFNGRTMTAMVACVLALVFADNFTDLIANVMENSQYSNEVDQFLSTDGTSLLRVLVFAVPPVMAFLFRRRIDAYHNTLINICVNMSVVSLGLYIASAASSGIFIGRLPIYASLYNYILLPWMIEELFTKDSAVILYVLMGMAYLVFYYYQIEITWGL